MRPERRPHGSDVRQQLVPLPDVEVDREEALGHRPIDGDVIGAIASADPAGADANDRVVALALAIRIDAVGVLEIVHAEADVPVGMVPATFAQVMADDHVQPTLPIEVVGDDRTKLKRLARNRVLDEPEPDSRDVAQDRVHADDDIGLVVRGGDIVGNNLTNHDSLLLLNCGVLARRDYITNLVLVQNCSYW